MFSHFSLIAFFRFAVNHSLSSSNSPIWITTLFSYILFSFFSLSTFLYESSETCSSAHLYQEVACYKRPTKSSPVEFPLIIPLLNGHLLSVASGQHILVPRSNKKPSNKRSHTHTHTYITGIHSCMFSSLLSLNMEQLLCAWVNVGLVLDDKIFQSLII